MINQVLVGLAFALLACAGACSGPPSSSQASGAQGASSTTTASTDIAAKVHACQSVVESCEEGCDYDWKTCVGTPGSGLPPQSCTDTRDACASTCTKQYIQCSQ